ncbi:PREDICTED: uncharacterized protein LOC108615047, partial [Drosophila arizonae]|uniref:Uncharacterized protein LOC108615047 n=1 Tax=Drosophila arizonae TaxID=7263 RepID=A0ABM1PC33_DROAR
HFSAAWVGRCVAAFTLGILTVDSFTGCLLCTCCRLARRRAESLDSYAPRTQSIVWPSMPTETARVLELTFLHTPDAVDCICRGCSRARKERCLEDCLNGTESVFAHLIDRFVNLRDVILNSNISGDDWFNGTHLLEDVDNTTTKSNGYAIIRNTKEANIYYVPLDPLRRVAFVALLLHILIVGGGLIIYSVVCCKSRTDRKRLLELKRRLQSPPTLQHIPNSPNCPCHGCRVARQILSGLIVQQIINERAERE